MVVKQRFYRHTFPNWRRKLIPDPPILGVFGGNASSLFDFMVSNRGQVEGKSFALKDARFSKYEISSRKITLFVDWSK